MEVKAIKEQQIYLLDRKMNSVLNRNTYSLEIFQ